MTWETALQGVLWLALAAAPLLPLPYVSARLIHHARSLWLLALLTGVIISIAPFSLWLALIGLWFLLRWPQEADPPRLLPSLMYWIGVGATWQFLLLIPRPWFAWATWGWLAIAGWHSARLIVQRCRSRGRPKGDLGSPVITALYLALVSPFCPWWAWPLLGAGLVLVWSWSALAGVAVGVLWLWPRSWPLMAAGAVLVAILWEWSPQIGGQRWWEWTPRGDTIDSLVSRWRGWQLLIHHGQKRWFLGYGPDRTESAMLRWGSRYDLELCWGEAFNEPLQFWFEYGVLGLAAVVAFCWPIVHKLNIGDPWSAAWIVGGVLALVHWPLRHASIGLVWFAISAYLVQ